jgi:hypothetical protein
MSILLRSTVTLGLLAITLAPTAAFADYDEDYQQPSGSTARVIQYDPNSSEDIYETYDNGTGTQYYSHRGDRQEGYYRNGNRGRHRGHYRNGKKRHQHSRFDNDGDSNYNRFGQPTSGGVYNRYPNSDNRPEVIYRPGSNQGTTGCVNSRFGTVCR